MKNQYFGDVRDLFKYDIIQHIVLSSTFVDGVLFVSMLTPDDNTREGNKVNFKKAKAGYNNLKLVNFLYNALKTKRKVELIKDYYDSLRLKFELINDFLLQKQRSYYFEEVLKKLEPSSLIFFDPDNGLEVKNSNEKHLMFDELRMIYDKMDESSILMIYQHFPRVKRLEYIKERQLEIKALLNVPCNFISDNEIVFFFTSKNYEVNNELLDILKLYSTRYPKLFFTDELTKSIEQQLALNY